MYIKLSSAKQLLNMLVIPLKGFADNQGYFVALTLHKVKMIWSYKWEAPFQYLSVLSLISLSDWTKLKEAFQQDHICHCVVRNKTVIFMFRFVKEVKFLFQLRLLCTFLKVLWVLICCTYGSLGTRLKWIRLSICKCALVTPLGFWPAEEDNEGPGVLVAVECDGPMAFVLDSLSG